MALCVDDCERVAVIDEVSVWEAVMVLLGDRVPVCESVEDVDAVLVVDAVSDGVLDDVIVRVILCVSETLRVPLVLGVTLEDCDAEAVSLGVRDIVPDTEGVCDRVSVSLGD